MSFLCSMVVQLTLLDEIKQAQTGGEEFEKIKVNIRKGKALCFVEDKQGVIRFQNQICMPQRWS